MAERALAVAGSEGVERGREREERDGREEVNDDIDVDTDGDVDDDDEGGLGEVNKLDRSGMIPSSEGKIDKWAGRREDGPSTDKGACRVG